MLGYLHIISQVLLDHFKGFIHKLLIKSKHFIKKLLGIDNSSEKNIKELIIINIVKNGAKIMFPIGDMIESGRPQ